MGSVGVMGPHHKGMKSGEWATSRESNDRTQKLHIRGEYGIGAVEITLYINKSFEVEKKPISCWRDEQKFVLARLEDKKRFLAAK